MKKVNGKQIDLAELFGPKHKQNERFTSRAAVNIHEFYLNGTIESSEEYIEWFDIIRNAGQTDIIKLYINSYGGDLFTAIQLMNLLEETQATVVVSVEGACMSAATMIFLMGDQISIADHCAIMIHTYSGAMIGKGNEMHAQAMFERTWSVDLIKRVYSGFLTEEEINHVIGGGDIWMNSEEAGNRLLKLKEYREAKDAENTEQLDE